MTKEIAAKNARVTRRPLSQRGPLAISGEKDKDFEYRFVNDIGSRIENFKQAGYEFVTDAELTVGDSRVSDASALGSGKLVTSNDGTKSYLMKIKKDWYQEDQAAKQASINEQEAAMSREASQSKLVGKGITIKD